MRGSGNTTTPYIRSVGGVGDKMLIQGEDRVSLRGAWVGPQLTAVVVYWVANGPPEISCAEVPDLGGLGAP